MKTCLAFFGMWLVGSGCHPAWSQSVSVVRLAQLESLLNKTDDTLRVVNFWATWCAPCVKELPQFEAVRQKYANRKLSVLLVNLDDPSDLTTKVKPFVKKRNLRSRVVLLDEPDQNAWIEKIAPEWSGALPMTLVVNRSKHIRKFIGKAFKEGELETIINAYKPE
ncbi:TlpA family protein disulfide reductase [Fibrisoma montanum]|uniref:TlpA family protein disulfide reductase n=1 Tax=Fibrisoma montanum TaxID=2305895 RepID=A0A418LWI0_9BACT|nr:TlpA family protein disulfide reductase [Fibrisoma montanum]RIV17587.1 TlpA family protein disulfide reductase [Fibrisoma montanum]